MKKKPLIAAGLVVLVLIVAVVVIMAKGNQGDMSMASSSAATSATMSNQVTIQNYMFSPMAITVKVGTTVTWTNKDSVSHTITADNVSSDAPSSMDIADGKSYSFTFKKAGTYTYHCFPHPYMHGTVIVKG
jgi:plastocyanin